MITFTSPSISPALALRCLLLGLIAAPAAWPQQTDVYVSAVVLYTKLQSGTSEAKEYGTYPEVKRFDHHGGLAPKVIDVVAVVNGKTSEQVVVVLEVFPVVGVTNWSETEGITDTQLLEASKTRLSAALRLEQTVKLGKRTDVKFADIGLAEIVERYKKKGFWPAELIFRVTAEPVAGETALSNNVMEFKLQMVPPD